MSIQFSVEAILEIGVQIEKNGRLFYLEAAKNASDESVKALFSELADWERQHVKLFERFQVELPEIMREDTLFDPENEFLDYVRAAADNHVFVASSDITGMAVQCQSPAEALDLALRFEKDSVVYYLTMQKVVAEYLGRQQVDALIDEELKHIALLSRKKKQLT
jgi:rubrerythrin